MVIQWKLYKVCCKISRVSPPNPFYLLILYFEIQNVKFKLTLDLAFDRLVQLTEDLLALEVVGNDRKNKNQA